MRERCKKYEESLKHRYLKIKTGLKDVANESDSENEEPERPMRFQRISQLMNCFDDDEFQSLLTRQQDQFKSYQNLDRLTSQLLKKEKQLKLKNVMHTKNKRQKKDESESE